MTIRFARCTVDIEARRVYRGAREIRLSPKAFELLALLIACRPRALVKAELMERVWTGVIVSDGSLARTVHEVRKCLGDSARRPRIVRTVHGFGYAFAAAATESMPGPEERDLSTCWLTWGSRELALPDGELIVGRDPEAAVFDSPKVSRRHARLRVNGRRSTIEDLDSKNGTLVRGHRINSAVELKPGDAIRIGPFKLVFGFGRTTGSTETEVEQGPV